MTQVSSNDPAALNAAFQEIHDQLGRRILAVERESRRWKRVAITMVLIAAIVLGLTAALVVAMNRGDVGGGGETLRARGYVLQDKSGVTRGSFGFGADDTPRLVLQDPKGRERVRLTLMRDGSAGLTLTDSTGRTRAVLGLLPDETSTLVFADRHGRTRTVLGLAADESSTLLFADRQGSTQAVVGVDAQGRPTFGSLGDQP